MANIHYSADSAFLPPSRMAFGVHPDVMESGVFVFERGFFPARETFPIID